jgi:hypothetical protein
MLTRKPHKGDVIQFHKGLRDHRLDDARFVVIEAKEDGICWMLREGAQEATCFIWRFNRTGEFNALAEIV